jgi:nucleoside permease NupC
MPTDWLYYWMLQPYGLALIASAVAIPFLFWRVVLGGVFSSVGFKPLVAGYVAALVGLLLHSFLFSYIEFTDRVSNGILPETDRWSTVPGWTIYQGVLSLVVVLPILGVIGVPWTAALVKRSWLGYRTIFTTVFVVWLSLALVMWLLPGNEWHRTHRLQSFTMWLKELLPGVLLVGLPFLFAIFWGTRSGGKT